MIKYYTISTRLTFIQDRTVFVIDFNCGVCKQTYQFFFILFHLPTYCSKSCNPVFVFWFILMSRERFDNFTGVEWPRNVEKSTEYKNTVYNKIFNLQKWCYSESEQMWSYVACTALIIIVCKSSGLEVKLRGP